MQPALRNSPNGAIQCVGLKTDIKGIVVEIDWGPRSGKQEDHTTSYNAFQTAVQNAMCGHDLKTAILRLVMLTNAITELPGYRFYPNDYLFNQVNLLIQKLGKLVQLLVDAPNDVNTALYVLGQAGEGVDDYLRVRNLVPGTKYDKSEVQRPSDYNPGPIEKEGKKLVIETSAYLGKEEAIFENVEDKIAMALQSLHDFPTDRKYPVTKDQLALQTAQGFLSFVAQRDQFKKPGIAEKILEIWLNKIYNTWSEVKELNWSEFCSLVIYYVRLNGSTVVKAIGQ
jgi:hypothetical protein